MWRQFNSLARVINERQIVVVDKDDEASWE